VLSVRDGLLEELSVQVSDFGELLNYFGSNIFVSLVLQISSILGIHVCLLQVIQHLEYGVNGITSFGTSLEKS
jgi:hypothetical protein